MEVETTQKQICYHCGDDCGNRAIYFDNKAFCCNGCKSVYEILQEKDACEYYQYEKTPGIKADSAKGKRHYEYLDEDEIKAKLLDFKEGDVSRVRLFIPAIHCSSCIWLLENLHQLHEGVSAAQVNFVKKQLSVSFYHDKISLRELVQLLDSIAYTPRISLDDSSNNERMKKSNRRLLTQIGVAGFAFGNIMLLSLPEYTSVKFDLEEEFSRFFGWFNLILAIPVFFYSGTDYLISAWKGLKKKLINIDVPISLGLIILFFRSVYEIVFQVGPGYFDSLAGLVFFLLIGKWYQNKTYQALSFERNYKSYFPMAVSKITDGGIDYIPIEEIQIGDRIRIRSQEIIPVDSILLSDETSLDYSFVSGESQLVKKSKGDFLYAGGRQMTQAIDIIAEKKVEQSYLTQLWNQDVYDKKQSSNLVRTIDKVSQYFTVVILLIALGSGLYWWFNDVDAMFHAISSVLIVACPCALALTIPFTFGAVMRLFGREGFYLKNTDVIERMKYLKSIVFDKTGTISLSVQNGYNWNGKELSENDFGNIYHLVSNSSHPMSRTLSQGLSQYAMESASLRDYEEVEGKGVSALLSDKKFKAGNASYCSATNGYESLSNVVHINIEGEYKGYFKFDRRYRNRMDMVLSDLGKRFSLHLLSGDSDEEYQKLRGYFEEGKMHFRQQPLEKLDYIKSLQKNGNYVMMIGDGLNDTGALKQSDVGIAIADDVYSFSPSSDAILDAKSFGKLNSFIRFAKRSFSIVYMSFGISFLYNIVGLAYAVQARLEPIVAGILMPLSSVSVVVFVSLAVMYRGKKQFK